MQKITHNILKIVDLSHLHTYLKDPLYLDIDKIQMSYFPFRVSGIIQEYNLAMRVYTYPVYIISYFLSRYRQIY